MPVRTGRTTSDDADSPALIVTILTLLGAALRAMYLAQPMRYDESVTYLDYASQPWATALGSYTYPNNHVLHTALVKVATGLMRSEERRVGKECRSRWSPYH